MTNSNRRFWLKVKKSDDCWEWIGAKSHRGYGHFSVMHQGKRITTTAHRRAYQIYFGYISDKIQVCHHCDNPSCVRPDHLFLGTCADNSADMVKKGGSARGEKHGRNKLTESQVLKIRKTYRNGGITKQKLADIYGVSDVQIARIVNHKNWKHI